MFLVSLVIGYLGIYTGSMIVAGGSFGRAFGTALIGAIAWALLSWIPLIGSALALIAWVTVINMRYEGGWINAIPIEAVSWIATLFILYLLVQFGIGDFNPVSVPGTT
ncbi:MAG: hypothetical protein ABEJ56_00850 [Candidatus Nanohaloarchaea archaeon]